MMEKFIELRNAAGLGDRDKFIAETGLSDRTLSNYDSGRGEPSLVLIKYLRLLANGCQYCRQVIRGNTPHSCEKEKESQEQKEEQKKW